MPNNYIKFGDYDSEDPVCCASLNKAKIIKDGISCIRQVWICFRSLQDKKIYKYTFMFVEEAWWDESIEDVVRRGSINVE